MGYYRENADHVAVIIDQLCYCRCSTPVVTPVPARHAVDIISLSGYHRRSQRGIPFHRHTSLLVLSRVVLSSKLRGGLTFPSATVPSCLSGDPYWYRCSGAVSDCPLQWIASFVSTTPQFVGVTAASLKAGEARSAILSVYRARGGSVGGTWRQAYYCRC